MEQFGIAFCESSGPALVRWTGNDANLLELAKKNALARRHEEQRHRGRIRHRCPQADAAQVRLQAVSRWTFNRSLQSQACDV